MKMGEEPPGSLKSSLPKRLQVSLQPYPDLLDIMLSVLERENPVKFEEAMLKKLGQRMDRFLRDRTGHPVHRTISLAALKICCHFCNERIFAHAGKVTEATEREIERIDLLYQWLSALSFHSGVSNVHIRVM